MKDKLLMDQPIGNYMKIRQLDEFMNGHKGYIAGGVFKNIFNDEKVRDVDVFFESKEDFDEAVQYYSSKDEYRKGYENQKVVSYIHKGSGIIVELIRHRFRNPVDMICEFDFTISQFVYYKEAVVVFGEDDEQIAWKIAFHEKFFEHLHMKRLVIDQEVEGILLPVNTFNRMFKYAKYGYFPCRESKGKIITAMREMTVFDTDMLGEQLYDGFD